MQPLDPRDAVIGAAQMLLPVREVPENRGRMVEAMQAFAGGVPGESWCADLVYYVGAHVMGTTRWPLPRSGACRDLQRAAAEHRIARPAPAAGDVFLVLDAAGVAHHTGFVSRVNGDETWQTVEGNSNDSGSREGVGVFANTRGGPSDARHYVFVRWVDAW